MTSIRLVATDRAAICKGCQLPIVWRVGVIRPLQMRDGLEHVCASYVKTSKGRRFFGGRRAMAATMASAPDAGEVAPDVIVQRGNKRISCKVCGFEALEWAKLSTGWVYVPFGTDDTSGTVHPTRPEACQSNQKGPEGVPA